MQKVHLQQIAAKPRTINLGVDATFVPLIYASRQQRFRLQEIFHIHRFFYFFYHGIEPLTFKHARSILV